MDGVVVLTELSSQTQVLEESKQKLPPRLPPNRVVVLGVLLLQHLEEQREIRSHAASNTNTICVRKDGRTGGRRRSADLSQLIVVRVVVVKAFDHVSRGPQDPAGEDGVKELHGDFSARHRLHLHGHHRLVYGRHTHAHTHQTSSTGLRFCRTHEISFLRTVMTGCLGRTEERLGPELCGQAGHHVGISEETLDHSQQEQPRCFKHDDASTQQTSSNCLSKSDSLVCLETSNTTDRHVVAQKVTITQILTVRLTSANCSLL